MATGTRPGLLGALRIDLQVLHETWMESVFPRQRDARQTALGKWRPETSTQQVVYYLWALAGLPVVVAVYPLLLAGYFLRYQTRKLGAAALRLGLLGVVVLLALVWGGLTVLVTLQPDAFQEGATVALALASGVAVVSAALSYLCWRVDGRPTTILLAYPFAVTAIFLPPVVAALFWEQLDGLIQFSDDIAYWVTNKGPDPLGVIDWLEQNFQRQDEDHLIIWFVASFPVGWVLGLLVTLADIVRPRSG